MRTSAILDIPTTGGVVRIYIPAPEPNPTGPGLVKRLEPIETTGESTGDWAPVVDLTQRRRRVA